MSENYTLSSYPAKWVDELLLEAPEFGSMESKKTVGARALSALISVTVFPVFLALDFTYYSLKGLGSWCFSKITGNHSLYEESVKCNDIAKKSLLGLCTFWAGLVWRDVVTNHFLPHAAPDGQVHPKGKLYSSKAEVYKPTTVEEIQEIVKEAKGKKVSIAGAGFCQGKQTLPPSEKDIHINMKGLNKVEINAETKTAKVGAGATWGQIQNLADKDGLAVQVMQASNVFSVGGSLSANCHGWDHIQGSLANTVLSMTIINAHGELERLKPDEELFKLVVGGYGMFGIIAEVELQLTDNEELFDSSTKVPIHEYVKHFAGIQENPSIKMHLYRLSLEHGKLLSEGWSQNYSSASPAGVSEHLIDEPEEGSLLDKALIQIARNSHTARTMYWKQEEKNLQKIYKARRNEIMRPKINSVFVNSSKARTEWLQEYFVPGEHLADFITFLGGVLNENDVDLMNASVRFVKQDTRSEMGYAKDGDRFAVVLFFSQSLNKEQIRKTERWVQRVVDKLTEINGTFYLPYMHFATKEQLRKCYPQWEKIKERKTHYDPGQVFDNGLYQDYFEEK